jgi:hypothetical protein
VSVACAQPPRGALPGASDAWETAAEPAADRAAPPAAVSALYAEAQAWPAANSEAFTSRGHQPERQVDVRVNDIARASYAELVTDTVFPEGSVLAEVPHAGSVGDSYAMLKDGRRWNYFVFDSRGAVTATGSLEQCAGCHAQAPADGIFGLPHGQ